MNKAFGPHQNIQIGNTDVSITNPVPCKSPSGNPSDTITRTADTALYAANDVISTSGGEIMEFAIGLGSGAKFIIYSAIMRTNDAGVIAGMLTYRLHLYTTAPTAIADNAAYAVITADVAKYLGYITLKALEDAGDFIFKYTSEINAVMALSGTSIFAQLQTIGTFTPASGTITTIELCIGEL